MTRLGMDSFDVPPAEPYEPDGTGEHFFGGPQPMPADSRDKSSIDKLIDINHYLVGRVQELEEIVGMQMQRQVEEQHERMRGTGQ